MMKKFLVLLMLLGTASMASATLQISIGSDQDPTDLEYSLPPGGHLTLGVWTNSDITAGVGETFFVLVCETAGGYIDFTTGTDNYPEDGGIFLEHSVSAVDAGIPLVDEDGILGNISLAVVEIIPAGTEVFSGIDFECLDPVNTLISLYETDGASLSLIDSVLIEQIPEPITFGLLGLGGLFLRRRK